LTGQKGKGLIVVERSIKSLLTALKNKIKLAYNKT
jgi:hypothetical protein